VDVFAISTYFTVSHYFVTAAVACFATFVTARSRNGEKCFMMCFLWLGGSTQPLARLAPLALVLAGLSTPLVLSVHTIVSFDFARISVTVGTGYLPPYFVAGAIFSGFAMVQLLVITRKVLSLVIYHP
jgi:molybdopterin-containing oxidoreductase family membrane subunit